MSVTGKRVELKSMCHIPGHVRDPGTAAKCGFPASHKRESKSKPQ